jgi:hypothetical protein
LVNGEKVFQGDAPSSAATSSSLVSMKGATAPRPKKGANQVGVKVKENYGGWAAPAALSGPELAAGWR